MLQRRVDQHNGAVPAQEIDHYLDGLEEPKRAALAQLREAILAIVPDAEQGISYGLPAFQVRGKTIAGFAAFKNHLSYLPHSGSVFAELGDDLQEYSFSSGALRFSVDEPLPVPLIEKLIAVRLQQAFPSRRASSAVAAHERNRAPVPAADAPIIQVMHRTAGDADSPSSDNSGGHAQPPPADRNAALWPLRSMIDLPTMALAAGDSGGGLPRRIACIWPSTTPTWRDGAVAASSSSVTGNGRRTGDPPAMAMASLARASSSRSVPPRRARSCGAASCPP